MNKVLYPTDPTELASFEKSYFDCLDHTHKGKINGHLRNIIAPGGVRLSFERLVASSFKDLIALQPDILAYCSTLSPVRKRNFLTLFDYKSNQPKIAGFFMQGEYFKFKVCHYCGIEYVNAFADVNDYFDGLDFLNRADEYDLMVISGIGVERAKEIIALRKLGGIAKIEDIGLDPQIHAAITKFDIESSHNHFTLDHVIPQKTDKFYSLCLYNFVPSCYSCNSKFKKAKEFDINDALRNISPTSDKYSLTDDFKFRLYYTKELKDIRSTSDFVLENTISSNDEHVRNFLRMFKINGRYKFHKDMILSLIERKARYPDSQIIKLAQKRGISSDEMRKEIFGEELFDKDNRDLPFIKFKKDAAEQLKITK